MRYAFIFVAIVVSGCVGLNHPSRIAVLQHPDTKQTVQCKVDPTGSGYRVQVENCIRAYEKAGYNLVSDVY